MNAGPRRTLSRKESVRNNPVFYFPFCHVSTHGSCDPSDQITFVWVSIKRKRKWYIGLRLCRDKKQSGGDNVLTQINFFMLKIILSLLWKFQLFVKIWTRLHFRNYFTYKNIFYKLYLTNIDYKSFHVNNELELNKY